MSRRNLLYRIVVIPLTVTICALLGCGETMETIEILKFGQYYRFHAALSKGSALSCGA